MANSKQKIRKGLLIVTLIGATLGLSGCHHLFFHGHHHGGHGYGHSGHGYGGGYRGDDRRGYKGRGHYRHHYR